MTNSMHVAAKMRAVFARLSPAKLLGVRRRTFLHTSLAVAGAMGFTGVLGSSASGKLPDFEDDIKARLKPHIRKPRPRDTRHLMRGALATSGAIRRYQYYTNPDNRDELECVVELGRSMPTSRSRSTRDTLAIGSS